MIRMLKEKKYKKSDSLLKIVGITIAMLTTLIFLLFAAATKGFRGDVDPSLINEKLPHILNLFGLILISYEFFSKYRYESNINRLALERFVILKKMTTSHAIFREINHNQHITEKWKSNESFISDEIEHENEFENRKFILAIIGITLTTIGTFLQMR